MPRSRRHVALDDTDPFAPVPSRPLRVRSRLLPADAHFEPHRHAWSQMAYCASGTLQVTALQVDGAASEVTYIVPSSRAVWIPPGALHSVHVLQAAEFRTVYLHETATPPGWSSCRVLVVSPLLRELVHALDAPMLAAARERLLTDLLLDELRCADTQPLGVPLPPVDSADKRLRALCEAVLHAPAGRTTLAQQAAAVGASERTMARLFRESLGTSYQQWRQQVVLAHALPLLARGASVSQVAAATGYASESAFTAMFKNAMGQPPSHFLRRKET